MDPSSLVPSPDVIPAPAAVFEILGGVTLFLHFLVINTVVGTLLLGLWKLFRPGGTRSNPFWKGQPSALALGSNLGDRREHLTGALQVLAAEVLMEMEVSSLWESAPVEVAGTQPLYLNICAVGRTILSPEETLDRCQLLLEASFPSLVLDGRLQQRRRDVGQPKLVQVGL